MCHRTQPQQRPELDLSTIVLKNGAAEETQREKYIKFYQRLVTSTRYVDVPCLCELGFLENVQWMLTNSSLTHPCIHNHPTYEPLTLEFLSSLSYSTLNDENMYLIGAAKFRWLNTEYALTQEALGDATLPTQRRCYV